MSTAKWQNIAGSKRFFTQNLSFYKNGFYKIKSQQIWKYILQMNIE